MVLPGPNWPVALNDFTRGMLAYYPNIPHDELKVVLVHSRDRILPELSVPLAAYALRQMAIRGVTFKLNTRVRGAGEGVVLLQPDEELRTRTLVWTAGTAPHPLLKTLPVQRDKRGGVIVDPTLAVPGREGVWCSATARRSRTGLSGDTCPPTAQFAVREAALLARNIRARLKGRPPKPFHYKSTWIPVCGGLPHGLCGNQRLPLLRAVRLVVVARIYLSKLPGFERKARVLVDWLLELFFPRDTVQTLDLDPH